MSGTTDDDTILRVIGEVAEEEAEIPAHFIAASGSASSVAGWDSLAHTRIIMGIEDRLGVTLDMDATMRAATFGDLAALIRRARDGRG